MPEKTVYTSTSAPTVAGANTTSGIPTFGVADSGMIGMSARQVLSDIGGSKSVSANEITANIAADLILQFCDEHGDLVTNLRLQRLLYFAQGWYLGLHGKPLFRDALQAWASGPVQPEVYARFLPFGSAPIVGKRPKSKVTKAMSNFIAELMSVYGRFSSFDLQRIACEETPWIAARNGLPAGQPSSNPIDLAVLKKFYNGKAKKNS